MQAPLITCLGAEPIDIVTRRATDPKMGERAQGCFNIVGLDEYDHKRPRTIAEPDDCVIGTRVDSPMDHPHLSVLFIKGDAGVGIFRQQSNVSKAYVDICGHSILGVMQSSVCGFELR